MPHTHQPEPEPEHTHDHEHAHEREHEHEPAHNPEHEHEHGDLTNFDFGFRCTLCLRSIGKPLSKANLGLAEDAEFEAGKMYRYDKCYCGFGRFVIAERTYIDPEVLFQHMSEHMAH